MVFQNKLHNIVLHFFPAKRKKKYVTCFCKIILGKNRKHWFFFKFASWSWYQKKPLNIQTLVQLAQKKNLGDEHKGKSKKKKKKNSEAEEWREQRSSLFRAEAKVTYSKKSTVSWSLFYLIFSSLNTWVFLVRGEYSLRGRLKCGLDCIRLHQSLVLGICLLKPPY